MSDYDIHLKRLFKESTTGNDKTEIWADITDKTSCTTMTRKIFWKDDDGIFHDETPNLPVEVRNEVDNAWIEKKRKW